MPPLIPTDKILERLRLIFSEGTPGREHIITKSTARVIFAAIFIGAILGTDRWLAPRHVYRMTDSLASTSSAAERLAFYKNVPKSSENSWYADNSREQARDQGVRQGLVPLNAIVLNDNVATTSQHGRYALTSDFMSLFDPSLSGDALDSAISSWRAKYLSAAALARAALLQGMSSTNVVVQHPQGGSTVLPSGESPIITKAVVEEFAHRFLGEPAVVWISDSKNKLFGDDALEKTLQIKIDAAALLPDVVLVDLNPPGREGSLLLVFVEVVSTDGPMTAQRQEAFLDLIKASTRKYSEGDAAFVTAYRDRQAAPVSRAMRQLAWRSFAWFMSEPDYIVQMHDGTTAGRKLSGLLGH